MKELRVYVVEPFGDDMEKLLNDDDAFMSVAERQGTVYSIYRFEAAYNTNEINTDNTYIKFIES